MGLFKKTKKPDRASPADREKNAGAREYVARIHDRSAERVTIKNKSFRPHSLFLHKKCYSGVAVCIES